ncbi:pseudouridine synthase [Leptolyngbya valderiana BDU 20041]|uniref:pseudouridine synthase n=1 Tax=Baaleninema simplex TaxID=2862350 RepID=UPI000344EADD|nr:pseudouridine synthase [Baaleninema simplex]MDC0834142.1 pseudouridine synthase [Geitlerinema sp. CS-897]OAB61399.1 pseudouridine synthase [Leptolyngbya valderiana BDU 20041]PPT06868.1 Ribosomal small subunit pseudouridine synthase A [Geitlerinema sp. FC II]
MEERLQKLLSQWGIASRRRAETFIRDGRVRVNGQTAELGTKADPERDRVELDGRLVSPNSRPTPLYLLLNKPLGVVSTCRDPQGRTIVLDLLPEAIARGRGIHPVGRLDTDSTGALLLTNDGDLTFRLTHPRYHIPKTYRVWVRGYPPESALRAWRRGVLLDGRTTLPARVRVLQRDEANGRTQLETILTEGRNRQIRRVAEQLGYPVERLHRTAIGPVSLNPSPGDPLPPGSYRPLQASELQALRTQLDLKSVLVRSNLKEHSG